MARFFTSDTHFCHRNILSHEGSGRQFADVWEMNEALIANWNWQVKQKDDEVWHLGDFSFGNIYETIGIVSRLNGRIFLVPGNHDSPKMLRALSDKGVTVMPPLVQASLDGKLVVMCHFPLLTWNAAHYGSWHLHGHSHGRGKWQSSSRLDVGVDALPGFRPYSWDEIKGLMVRRAYEVVDHHEPRS